MPNPMKGESRKAFEKRCIPQIIKEGMSQKQAVAVCKSMWKKK